MTSFGAPDYPSDLSDPVLQDLATKAIDWAQSHGLVMKPAPNVTAALPLANSHYTGLATHAPLALFPSPIPRASFRRAADIQPHLNSLFHRIANDYEFLVSHMEGLVGVDDFTTRLYAIYQRVREQPLNQPITLAYTRSDYLLHQSTDPSDHTLAIQQVEFNTISVSFASLAQVTSNIHRYLWSFPEYRRQLTFSDPSRQWDELDHHLPPNQSLHGLPSAIAKAWQLYGNPKAIVLMVVQPNERNIFDQRFVEYELQSKHQVKVIRRTLKEVDAEATLHPETQALLIGGEEIAVTYYRSAYAPQDYGGEEEWAARMTVELSKSVKCPNISYQLAGTKKVQEVLSRAGVLERFISDPDICSRIRECFTGLYPLDSTPAGRQALQQALATPERFVLKPQREGGGNNVYGHDIPSFIQTLSPKELGGYILMDLICPPPTSNILINQGQLHHGPVISELGIFGVWLSDANTVHLNAEAGHLLRTKVASSNEGGIAAGFGVIDSPLLI